MITAQEAKDRTTNSPFPLNWLEKSLEDIEHHIIHAAERRRTTITWQPSVCVESDKSTNTFDLSRSEVEKVFEALEEKGYDVKWVKTDYPLLIINW